MLADLIADYEAADAIALPREAVAG
jgi:hypothetical protein